MAFHRSKFFVPALFLILCAAIFKFGPGGVTWFWTGQPVVAVVLLAASAVFWVRVFSSLRKSKP